MDSSSRSTGIEVGDIFREYGAAYRAAHKLPLYQLKVMSAIEKCRTSALGGHIDECDVCGYQRISYNSCRNRHCPKCQALAREEWLLARKQDLLPVTYFHVVFTVPDILNQIALVNQRVIYKILFKAGSETLLVLGKDPTHIGAEIGFIAFLHTWGQTMMDHPHLHCIVPGGGLSEDGVEWMLPKKMTKQRDFFIHVNVISALFKGKFLYYLKKAYKDGDLRFEGNIKPLATKRAFQELIDKLYGLTWVTYCKQPFGGPEQVLEYLGRYTHRVAISNSRIVKLEHGKVTFRWRDYRDGNKTKLMTLDVFEFIRRLLLHILPKGFVKIRYYGILASRNHQTKLAQCKQILDVAPIEEKDTTRSQSWQDLLLELTGIDPRICPKCEKGHMIRKEIIARPIHGPP